jgi:hypothetical protein
LISPVSEKFYGIASQLWPSFDAERNVLHKAPASRCPAMLSVENAAVVKNGTDALTLRYPERPLG